MTTTEPRALRRLRFAWTAAVVAGAISPAVGQVQIQVARLGPSTEADSRAYSVGALGVGGAVGSLGVPNAALWNGTNVELLATDPGETSVVRAVGDDYVAGHVSMVAGSATVALATLWTGPNRTRSVLNPPTESQAVITSVRGNQQVGILGTSASIPSPVIFRQAPNAASDFVSVKTQLKTEQAQPANRGYPVSQAVVWNGTSQSMVRLAPTSEHGSVAMDTDGVNQVGAVDANPSQPHAALWRGTAESYVNLHPANAHYSLAYGTDVGRTVGVARFIGSTDEQPVIWEDSSANARSLVPNANYRSGTALDIAGDAIVGYIYPLNEGNHAALWLDLGATFIDLHLILNNANLPDAYFRSSARSISIVGDEITIAGFALGQSGRTDAIQWSFRVPDPSTAGVLFGASIMLQRRRRITQ